MDRGSGSSCICTGHGTGRTCRPCSPEGFVDAKRRRGCRRGAVSRLEREVGTMALTKVKSFKYVNRDRLSESELYSCNYSNKSNLFCAIVYSIPCTA